MTTFTRKGKAFWLFSHAGVMLFGSFHAQGRGFWLFSRAWVKLLGIFHAKGEAWPQPLLLGSLGYRIPCLLSQLDALAMVDTLYQGEGLVCQQRHQPVAEQLQAQEVSHYISPLGCWRSVSNDHDLIHYPSGNLRSRNV